MPGESDSLASAVRSVRGLLVYGDAGAREQCKHFADCPLAARGLREGKVRLDLVVIATAVFQLGEIACLGQVGDDAVRASFGDAQLRGNVAQPHPRVVRQA